MKTKAMTQPLPHPAMGYFYHVEFGLLRRCLLTGTQRDGNAQWLIITPAEIIFLQPHYTQSRLIALNTAMGRVSYFPTFLR